MVDILAPFQQATDFAQKQNSVSGSIGYSMCCGTRVSIEIPQFKIQHKDAKNPT